LIFALIFYPCSIPDLIEKLFELNIHKKSQSVTSFNAYG
jgi:hypothetical protein